MECWMIESINLGQTPFSFGLCTAIMRYLQANKKKERVQSPMIATSTTDITRACTVTTRLLLDTMISSVSANH